MSLNIRKQLLINACIAEEIRVAFIEEKSKKIIDLNVEVRSIDHRKSNIYLGRVARIEPSLEAAFIDYGEKKQGFLPLKELNPLLFIRSAGQDERIKINQVLKVGQEFLVQVEKSERSNKGAALTTFISLAGSYLVLMPNSPRSLGISRRIEGEDREHARTQLSQLEVPKDMGIILRTAGIGRPLEELQFDLAMLKRFWSEYILAASLTEKAPRLIHRESDIITRTLRDWVLDDVSEIWVDEPECFQQVQQILQRLHPNSTMNVKLYEQKIPMFHYFDIETAIKQAYCRLVELPSGGSIVFDQTEALLAVDVNSSRATDARNIEETALQTNLEAAEEIARQLYLRDLGGLVVIDFIDMSSQDNQRKVELCLKNSIAQDKARIQLGRISRFGLLEMVRQRLRPSLEEGQNRPCNYCHGSGQLRSIEAVAVDILREIEYLAGQAHGGGCLQLRTDASLTSILTNEKKRYLIDLEDRYQVRIVILPDHQMQYPDYDIHHVRSFEARQLGTSFEQLNDKSRKSQQDYQSLWGQHREEPAVVGMIDEKQVPRPRASHSTQKPPVTSALVQKAWKWLREKVQDLAAESHDKKEEAKTVTVTETKPNRNPNTGRSHQHQQHRPQRRKQATGQKSTDSTTSVAATEVTITNQPNNVKPVVKNNQRPAKTKESTNRRRERPVEKKNEAAANSQRSQTTVAAKVKKPLAIARLNPRTKVDVRRKNQSLNDLNRCTIGDFRVWILSELYPNDVADTANRVLAKGSIAHCRRRLPKQTILGTIKQQA